MTLDDVRALDLLLQARDQALSANKLTEHLGGSKRDALRLLREYRAEAQAPPLTLASPVAVLEPVMVPDAAAPAPPAPEAGPVTLLQQAEQALRQALAEERRIRRGLAEPGTAITWDDLGRCQHQSRQAQDQVDKLQRSTATLRAAIPAARIDARRATGELAALEEETRRRLIKARREAQQAEADLARMITDLVAIAGAGAVPPEQAG